MNKHYLLDKGGKLNYKYWCLVAQRISSDDLNAHGWMIEKIIWRGKLRYWWLEKMEGERRVFYRIRESWGSK